MNQDYFKELNVAVTVCNENGIIVYMNQKSAATFQKYSGSGLIGKNIFDCHPVAAADKIREMMKNRSSNSYTIEKKGVKKLIHQLPWYEAGEYKGFIEFSIEIPFEMKHFNR